MYRVPTQNVDAFYQAFDIKRRRNVYRTW
jgi:predicted metalloendopeptidase